MSPEPSDPAALLAGLAGVLSGFEDPAALVAPDGRIVAGNRAWDVHGFTDASFVDGDVAPVQRVLRGEVAQLASVGRRGRRDGWQWYRSRVRAITGIADVAAVLVHRDVTGERRLQLRMAQSPVAHLELATDGALLSVNERWEEIRGRPVGAELGTRWLRDTPADERRALLQRLEEPEPFAFSITTIGADERTCAIELELEPALDGEEWIGWHASATDVTHVRALADTAFTDDLTGVANRGLFETTVARTINRRRDEHPAAVLFLDLDAFKPVNDTHGHAAGDDLLRQIAERITSVIRPADLVARYGGDEFAVLVDSADAAFAARVGERLIDAIRRPFQLDGVDVEVGVSVGVALTAPTDDVEAVVARADEAMYEAKRSGGDRVVVAAPPAEDGEPLAANGN